MERSYEIEVTATLSTSEVQFVLRSADDLIWKISESYDGVYVTTERISVDEYEYVLDLLFNAYSTSTVIPYDGYF